MVEIKEMFTQYIIEQGISGTSPNWLNSDYSFRDYLIHLGYKPDTEIFKEMMRELIQETYGK